MTPRRSVVGEAPPDTVTLVAGYWFYAGTSQATALISGTAARVLALGAPAEHVTQIIQRSAAGAIDGIGYGMGNLEVRDAEELAINGLPERDAVLEIHAALLPALRDNGDGTVTPIAHVSLLNQELAPPACGMVFAQLRGEGGGLVPCDITKRSKGECLLEGEPVPSTSGGQPRALSWQWTVSGVEYENNILRPSTSPFGLRVFTVGGSGISTSPFGLRPVTLATIDGSGISTSPFGVRSMFSYAESQTVHGSSFGGDPVLLGTGTIAMADGSDGSTSLLGQFVAGGGWQDADGQPGGQATVGTGVVVTASQQVGVEGLGSGGWEL